MANPLSSAIDPALKMYDGSWLSELESDHEIYCPCPSCMLYWGDWVHWMGNTAQPLVDWPTPAAVAEPAPAPTPAASRAENSRHRKQKNASQNRLRRRERWLRENGVGMGILLPDEKIPHTAMEVRDALLRAQNLPGVKVPEKHQIQPDELNKAPAGKGTGRNAGQRRGPSA